MTWHAVPRHVEGRTKAGSHTHAVEFCAQGYDAWALCGVSCNTVDRETTFDVADANNCQRCRVAVWRGMGVWVS